MHRNGNLAGTQGDATNAVLAAAGYNFRLVLNWLRLLLCLIASPILPRSSRSRRSQTACRRNVDRGLFNSMHLASVMPRQRYAIARQPFGSSGERRTEDGGTPTMRRKARLKPASDA